MPRPERVLVLATRIFSKVRDHFRQEQEAFFAKRDLFCFLADNADLDFLYIIYCFSCKKNKFGKYRKGCESATNNQIINSCSKWIKNL